MLPEEMNTPDFEQGILDFFKQKISKLKSQRSDVETKWTVCDDIYDNRFNGRSSDRELENDNFVPLGRQIVRNLGNEIYNRAIANPESIFGISAKSKEDKERQYLYEGYLKQTLITNHFKDEMDKIIENALRYGIGVAQVEFSSKKKRLRRIVDGAVVEEEKTIYKNACLRNIEPSDFYFDCNEPDWEKTFKVVSTFVSHQEAISKYSHKADELERLFGDTATDGYTKTNTWDGFDSNKKPADKAVVHECYGTLKVNGKYYDDMQLIVVDESVVVSVQKNPYYCTVLHKFTPRSSKDGWGYGGILYESSGTIKGYNRFNKILVEGIEYVINPAFLVPNGMMNQDTKVKPGEFIPINPDTLGGMKPIPLSINPSGAVDVLPAFERNIQGITGAVRQLTGDVSTMDSTQTATEFQGLAVAANKDMDRIIDKFNRQLKLPVIEAMAHVQACYCPEEKTVEVPSKVGKTFGMLKEEDHFADWRFIVIDNKSKQAQLAQMQQQIQMLQVLLQLPNARNLNLEEITKQILASVGLSVDSMYRPDIDVMTEEANTSLQKMMIQAMLQQASNKFVDVAPYVLELFGKHAQQTQRDLENALQNMDSELFAEQYPSDGMAEIDASQQMY